ncbi:hypothetical protein SAMN05518865_10957 [Duganella sp. CF458]|uniref:hypothetical protein n=1 Tax=Duganella sp. CF458 TaxID=1884368 RepID=UPI0008E984FB|nr:hypothetical protein [Duganella sp. CF458]SFG17416.1 hypothetical protein SAMN05518865_10957 [Duganella sp. CF458]
MKLLALIAIATLLVLQPAKAAGQHARFELDWNRPGEVLTYQSCGCADSCWTAELRKGRKLKARLRCDCEKLYFAKERGPERIIADRCDEFNTEGKMDLIPQRIKELE